MVAWTLLFLCWGSGIIQFSNRNNICKHFWELTMWSIPRQFRVSLNNMCQILVPSPPRNPLNVWYSQCTRHFLFPSKRGDLSERWRGVSQSPTWLEPGPEPGQLSAEPRDFPLGYSQLVSSTSFPPSGSWQHLGFPIFQVQGVRITRWRRTFKCLTHQLWASVQLP